MHQDYFLKQLFVAEFFVYLCKMLNQKPENARFSSDEAADEEEVSLPPPDKKSGVSSVCPAL